MVQISEFFFDVSRKCRPITHAKLRPRLRGNCAPPRQRFALQQHDGNFHLFSTIRHTAHCTELLDSEEPITKFSSVSLELIWLVNFDLGSPYCPRACSRLLNLMGRSLSSLKLGVPSSHHFLYQSLDGWIRICNGGGRLMKQVLIGQTLDICRHRFTYTGQTYAAQKLKSAQ